MLGPLAAWAENAKAGTAIIAAKAVVRSRCFFMDDTPKVMDVLLVDSLRPGLLTGVVEPTTTRERGSEIFLRKEELKSIYQND